MKIFKPGDRVHVEHTGQNDWIYERFDPDCEMNLPHQAYSPFTNSYLWVKDSEIHVFEEELKQSQPKTQQPTQEFTFTLDDLAKACDTSGIGSQKFLELQRVLTNLK